MKDFSQSFNGILIETYHNALLMEETKRKYSSGGFSIRDRNAISYLKKHPEGVKISVVADYLKISRPSATTLIKKLEKYNLVEKISQSGNDRNTLVRLTRKGRLFSTYQRRYRERIADKISDGLTDSEKKVLYEGFCKLNQLFIDSINESERIHNHSGKQD
ncbi:MAG: MarR family transcriptional regulator [Firmicutes bacterium]|nr:MarR family transcriptional regulator [Bacillota bacterium]